VTGTAKLVRLILRRDRFLLPLWVLVLAVLPTTYAASIAQLYPTAADRAAYAAGSASNASYVALLGPLFGSSLGALTAQRSGMLFLIVGLVSVLTVIRHTRAEEEAGRRELLGAIVLGRQAGLTAALAVTCAADLLLGILVALGLVGQDLPAGGAVAFGLALAACGWVFAMVGAVAAQFTESAGGARGIGLSVLGIAFALRMAGDAGDGNFLHWLSPIGWGQHVRAFAGERWWALGLATAAAVALAAVAYPLSARRDLGAGILPARLGPADAAPALHSPLALAWRLHRTALLGWVTGLAAFGVVLGSTVDYARNAAEDSKQVNDMMERLGGAGAFSDIYLAGVMSIAALAAAGYAIQAALKMRAEEAALRSEPVLATAVTRAGWTASHVAFSALGPAVGLLACGVGAGLVYGLSVHDVGGQLPRVIAAAMVQLPAVWVLGALTVLLFGLLPRLAPAAWAALAACLFLGQVGAILQLSQWAMDVSPFTHVPKIPGGTLTVAPLVWLVGIAAVLGASGFAGFRRRDLPVT
jgi:ABC-2 type transport system permease protein